MSDTTATARTGALLRNADLTVQLMAVIFFFSGFSSLLYEVVWMRRLSLFFGSEVYSAALTLSAFMGGLTIGGLLAARYADRLRQTLLVYGILEVAIGIYAWLFPRLLNAFSPEYRQVYQAFFAVAPWKYHGFRILIAAVILLIPTTAMGATLPLMVKRFGQNGRFGQCSGFFYSVNTLGALSGVLGVGFILLPSLGITRSTWVGVFVNVAIGAIAILVALSEQGTPGRTDALLSEPAALATSVQGFNAGRARDALIAIALSGMGALALEVVWMRVLTQSFSGAVYSFSIMLTCFLFGLYYGSRWISPTIDNRPDPVRFFAELELYIGGLVSLLAVLIYFVPSLFSRLLWGGIAVARGNFAVPCTVAQFVVSGLLIALPTILLGATFPVAVRICTPNVASIGRGTARVYAANTAGAVVGALLAGPVLIPAYGTRVSLLITAALFAAAGIFLIWREEGGWKTVKDRRVQIGATVVAALAIVAMILPHQIVLNFLPPIYGSAQVIYHGEGIAHTVDILRTKQNVTVMSIAGNMEADTSYVQRRHFILKADLPLLLQRDSHDVAVIGLGLGITLSAIARYPGIQHVQVIELSPEMVKAQAHVEGLTSGVLQNSKVRVRIDDGRNFLAMSNASFDMITADPIHPRNSGVGYLYTREYYEALKRRLRPDGIVCQWMPMYEISKKSFDVAFRTFVSVFPHASFWYVRGHGLFVATLGRFAIDYPTLAERLEDPVVKRDLASINISGPTDFLSYMLMGPPEISAYMAANPSQLLNTDDNAYLEYHTPFEFLLSNRIEVAAIVAGLLPYAGLDLEAIQGLPPGDQPRLMEAWGRRRDRIVPEMISPPEVR